MLNKLGLVVLAGFLLGQNVAFADKQPTPVITEQKPNNFPAKFKLYGFIELNGWFNDARYLGNDALLLTLDSNDRSFGMSPRGTRLGTSITFPTLKSVNLSGKIEIDFFTDYTNSLWAAARPKMRMRHAFMDINKDYGNVNLGSTIGSTWSIVSPLFPATINPAAGWAIGNIWQRMPQVQVYGHLKLNQDLKLSLKVAAARPMTGASIYATTFLSSDIDAGDAAFAPQLQAALDLSGEVGPLKMLVSVGGVYGKENYDQAVGITKTATDGLDYAVTGKSDVFGVMAALKLAHKYFGISGEYYTGKNIDVFGSQIKSALAMSFDAAAGQFVVSDGVQSMGGWAQLSISPTPKLAIHGGYGFDDPDQDQTDAVVLYDKNEAGWVSAFYTLFGRLTFGLCWMQITTHFHGADYQSGNSYMFVSKLTF